MKKMSKKVVFFGNERLATGVTTTTPTLRALIQAGYEVTMIVSNYADSRSRNARVLEIRSIAEQHNMPIRMPAKPRDIEDELLGLNADVGVLVAYGRIVPQRIIDIFPCGIVNIHPSLLPLHRGPTPLESVILNRESETGVSLMRLTKEMDAGPIYTQKRVPLTGRESKQELADKLLTIGKDLLIKSLPDILEGSLTPSTQRGEATYDTLISKEDGAIDWDKPAGRIEQEVRAYAEWPKSRGTLGNTEVIITKAYAEQGPNGPAGRPLIKNGRLSVHCGNGLLTIERLKPAGKAEMSAAAFLAGYSNTLT